jgi:hypothetical protein
MADHISKERYAASKASDGQDIPLSTLSDYASVPDHMACDNHEDRYGRIAHYDRSGNGRKYHGRLCDECLRELTDEIIRVPSQSYFEELRENRL